MENPYEIIIEKLDAIEQLIKSLQQSNYQKPESKEISNVVMTGKETADFLRISTVTLHKYKIKNLIPYFKVGARDFYRLDELNEMLQKGVFRNVICKIK